MVRTSFGVRGHGRSCFIAKGHIAVVPAMLRQEVGRQRHFCCVVVNGKTLGNDVRIVRRIERHIAKKRAARVLLEKPDRLIGEDFAGVPGRELRLGELAIGHVAELGLHRVGHAAGEDRTGHLKAAWNGGRPIVPLATHERGIPRATECRGPGFVAQQLFIDPEQRPPGQQHGAGWHAGRSVHPALHVGAVEGEAASHEAVEVWRLDLRIAQRGDGIGALVIGEEQEDVQPVPRQRRGA